jgi:hypothetical protein
VVQYYGGAQTRRERHATSQVLVIIYLLHLLPVTALLFVVLPGPLFPYHPSC